MLSLLAKHTFLYIFFSFFCESVDLYRNLYDVGLPNFRTENISTISTGVTNPVGITFGFYHGIYGLYITSLTRGTIFFMDTSSTSCERSSCSVVKIAGVDGLYGLQDGSVGSATFSYPSRLVYLNDSGVLVISDKVNGYLRMLNTKQGTVKTMVDAYNKRVRLQGSLLSITSPEIDLKVNGSNIYASDSWDVYNITICEGYTSVYDCAVMTQYSALETWQEAGNYGGWGSYVYISSIALDTRTSTLGIFIAVFNRRNAILWMPYNINSPSQVVVILSDNRYWGNIPISYPLPINGALGVANSDFPVHIEFSESDQALYMLEAYASTSSSSESYCEQTSSCYSFGSVAIRRLDFVTNTVDYYAGNVGSFFAYYGKRTGFQDGTALTAQFRLPMTLAIDKAKLSRTYYGGPLMFVSDYIPNAIRSVFRWYATRTPTKAPVTAAPSTTSIPTNAPSVKPTIFPTSTQPTFQPSTPTSLPSILPTEFPSFAPTNATMSPTVSPSRTRFPSSIPTKSVTTVPSSLFSNSSASPTSTPTLLHGKCLR